jgi:carboxymethylenebutenolidase
VRNLDKMIIHTEFVNLPVLDGTSMRAFVARPEDPHLTAGVMVFQEIFGVNRHIREVTERCARGYTDMAPGAPTRWL